MNRWVADDPGAGMRNLVSSPLLARERGRSLVLPTGQQPAQCCRGERPRTAMWGPAWGRCRMCHEPTLGESGVGCPHPPRRFTRVIYLEIRTALKVTKPAVEGCRARGLWPGPSQPRPSIEPGVPTDVANDWASRGRHSRRLAPRARRRRKPTLIRAEYASGASRRRTTLAPIRPSPTISSCIGASVAMSFLLTSATGSTRSACWSMSGDWASPKWLRWHHGRQPADADSSLAVAAVNGERSAESLDAVTQAGDTGACGVYAADSIVADRDM